MANISNNIIVITGWRGAYKVCGSFGMALAIVGFLTMKEAQKDKTEKEIEQEIIQAKENNSSDHKKSSIEL